jgi:hypothetical protein
MVDDLVTVTVELIDAGQSESGGWSKAQLALIGVAWPPPAGWKGVAVGRRIPRADAERFIALRAGRQVLEGRPGLFG